jgi:ferredoxin
MQTTTASARTLSASFSSSSSSSSSRAFQNRRATSSLSKKRCIARAEKDKFARDTIDLSKRKIGPGTAPPVKVTFLGANNSSVTVDCPTDQYILDAALDAGLELPFTCRGGICGCVFFSSCIFLFVSLSLCLSLFSLSLSAIVQTLTQLSFLPHTIIINSACVAKCVSGDTDQSDITDLEFTLDEDEQKEGLTLLCMAYPVGDVVIETQSDWGMRVGEWKGATGEILGREPTKLMDDDPNRIGL